MLAWIDSSWLAEFMRAYQWAFPISEAIHFVGLVILMGSVVVMDLRLLGFARGLPVRVIHTLLPWAWVGFTINLITGTMFFATLPTFYYPNMSLRIKVVLLLLAGLNALWFQLTVSKDIDSWPDDVDVPGQVKLIAGTSLALWIAILCFGRFIMYWPPI